MSASIQINIAGADYSKLPASTARFVLLMNPTTVQEALVELFARLP